LPSVSPSSHQYSSLVSACLYWRQALSSCTRTRCKADWSDCKYWGLLLFIITKWWQCSCFCTFQAHYATAELDEGPIIEQVSLLYSWLSDSLLLRFHHFVVYPFSQDIARISHRDAVNDLIRKGRILEKNTLVGAVKAHLEDRIIVFNNKCVVFGD
jgi:hypothetical protein